LLLNKYGLDYRNLGHGSYMIGFNGSSYSHHKKDENMKMNSFKFNPGDII